MNEKSIMIQVGALVHDVGKLAQRAKAQKSPEDDFLQPSTQGRHSHWHVLYTDHFVRHHLPLPLELEGRREELALLASIHHNPHPENLAQMCVAAGDRLAAGSDRYKDNITEHFRMARLNCILEEVALTKKQPEREDLKKRMRLLPFAPQKDVVFPVDQRENEDKDKDEFVQEYKQLYDGFLQELSRMPEGLPFKHYLPWLLRIMEKYLWCVPSSSYKNLPDISLYDHCVLTASVAQSLWIYHQDHPDIALDFDQLDMKKFILFGGDLSGIQRYIFGISETGTKGAVRLFRARSFYLQALTRSVILDFCKQAGLSQVCQIMDAGGKFILLLPATEKIRKLIFELQNRVDEFFVARFKGQLALCLAHLEIAGQDLLLGNFEKTLDAFNLCLDESKTVKFKNYLQKYGSVLGDGYEQIKDEGICDVCDQHPAAYEEDSKHICKICWQQMNKIGRKLPRAEYIVFGEKGAEVFAGLKVFVHTEQDKEIEDYLSHAELILGVGEGRKFGHFWLAGHLPAIKENELKDKKFLEKAKETYSEKSWDDLTGETKTFELIAHKACKFNEEEDEYLGRPLLCLLKADVDNLGLVFSLGLKKRLSLSRFASMSRMLNSFFAGYLVRKIEQEAKFQDTYIVFAGGDDLFLIGPWHQTIDLALEIRREFEEFAANNPDFSLSCGLHLIKPSFPVRRAAPAAEDVLEKAKARPDADGFMKKDAVCVFDKVLSWDNLEKQVRTGRTLEDKAINKTSPVTRAFVYRLLRYAKDADRFAKWDGSGNRADEYLRCGLYASHVLYEIARNIMKVKEGKVQNEDEVKFLRQLIQMDEGAKSFAQNIVGIQYALCAIRK